MERSSSTSEPGSSRVTGLDGKRGDRNSDAPRAALVRGDRPAPGSCRIRRARGLPATHRFLACFLATLDGGVKALAGARADDVVQMPTT